MHPRTRIAVAAGALVVGGLAALMALPAAASRMAGDPAPPRVEVPDEATVAQPPAVVGTPSDATTPVIDRDGTPRGHVRNADLVARDDRVTAALVTGFREPAAPYDDEYERLGEALRILDPVPVVDAGGKTVGYFTSHFLSVEEHGKAVADARATVAELMER